jgi:hypothetical protein
VISKRPSANEIGLVWNRPFDALNYLLFLCRTGTQLQEARDDPERWLKPNMGYIPTARGSIITRDYEKAVATSKSKPVNTDDPTINGTSADGYQIEPVWQALSFYEKALTLEPKPDQIERLKNKIKETKEIKR